MFSEFIKCEEKDDNFQLERGYGALWANELWQSPHCRVVMNLGQEQFLKEKKEQTETVT